MAGNNNARDFHRFVHREEKAFPVDISQVRLRIKTKKKNNAGRLIKKECMVDQPCIMLSSWMASILRDCPEFFLAGHTVEDPDAEAMLDQFWQNYEQCESSHPIFESKTREERKRCIPVCVHGDEGRGLSKTPVLVISYQVVIPWNGETVLNFKKYLRSISCQLLALCTTVQLLNFVEGKSFPTC